MIKNASLIFLCCILCIVITPITIHLCNNIKQKDSDHSTLMIKVLQSPQNRIIEMPFEEYVWRVTAKEMPSTFEDEALKAQAVAARTFAAQKINKQIPEHYGADVCTNFNHCTAFLLPDEDVALGKQKNAIIKKLRSITSETKNQILTYDGEPILAVFHAISSGITEKSSDVWVKQLPYLINVDSSLDKKVDGFQSSVTYSITKLKEIFDSNNNNEIRIISRTAGGSVEKIIIFGKTYSGSDVRQKLKLRSANFTVTANDENVTFDVIGYGHGVGMSQTGANEYAKTGMTYKEILAKYYPGTKISYIEEILPSWQN